MGLGGNGFIPSDSLSEGIGIDEEGAGANVGYLIVVSRWKEVMSSGDAFVKSIPMSKGSTGYVPFVSGARPANSLERALALLTSFIPPRQANKVFQRSKSNFLTGYPFGNRSFNPATILNSINGREGLIPTTASVMHFVYRLTKLVSEIIV